MAPRGGEMMSDAGFEEENRDYHEIVKIDQLKKKERRKSGWRWKYRFCNGLFFFLIARLLFFGSGDRDLCFGQALFCRAEIF